MAILSLMVAKNKIAKNPGLWQWVISLQSSLDIIIIFWTGNFVLIQIRIPCLLLASVLRLHTHPHKLFLKIQSGLKVKSKCTDLDNKWDFQFLVKLGGRFYQGGPRWDWALLCALIFYCSGLYSMIVMIYATGKKKQ